MNAPVLVALEQRAGASFDDYEAWLAQRATGLTGTQIRDLYTGHDLGGRRVTIDSMVRQKLGLEPDHFRATPYTAWGNYREPFMAAKARERFGLVPEKRVFHAPDEPLFLISPDGTGLDFDEQLRVGEYKTGVDIGVDSDAFVKKGYFVQMQWSMRVTGARRCLYVWEERIEVSRFEFEPGEMHFEWIEYDEAFVERELEPLGREFLAALAEARVNPPAPPEIDEELDTDGWNYLRYLEEEKEITAAKKEVWARLLAAGQSQVSESVRITYNPGISVEVEDIDYDAARATAEGAAWFKALQEAQAAWDRYCEAYKTTKTVTGRPTLRVTAVKVKGQGNGYEDD